MDDPKAQLADKLKSANNILVTVSRNPSVDQLASCIGLTLLLNKQGKHAAAVFSGTVPSTLEFLQPEDTLEKNTDSLRDFIVSLDKSKADKLRYKVEDNVVRIFITPYRTSISEADLTFTQGDFNVEVMVALGVHLQEDLDQAITAHGRILHDATIATINTSDGGDLGTINWNDSHASSLSELVTDLAKMLGKPELVDGQIATALLTGIVAETDRFSNEKTSSQTMNASATLLAAGANQQLVATKLSDPSELGASIQSQGASDASAHDAGDGLLEIDHVDTDEEVPPQAPETVPEPAYSEPELASGAFIEHVQSPEPLVEPEAEAYKPELPSSAPPESLTPHSGINVAPGARMITEPPSLGSFLSPTEQGAADPLGMPVEEPPLLFGSKKPDLSNPVSAAPPPEPAADATPPAFSPPPPAWEPPAAAPEPAAAPAPWEPPSQPAGPPADTSSLVTDDVANHTLAELEQSLANQTPAPAAPAEPATLDAARDEVNRALTDSAASLQDDPIQSLGAQPLGSDLHPAAQPGPYLDDILSGQHDLPAPSVPAGPVEPPPDAQPPLPPSNPPAAPPQVIDSSAPPPVPPPIPFQFGTPPSQ